MESWSLLLLFCLMFALVSQETYGYYTLPFCRGMKEEISHYHETIGEALQV